MSIATTAILTKGLTGGASFDLTALDYGSTITTPFDLLPRVRTNLPPSGGGPYPYPAHNRLEPGQAHKFFKPIDTIDELSDLFKPLQQNTNPAGPYYMIPYDQVQQYLNIGDQKRVVIDIAVGDKHVTRNFTVSNKGPKDVQITNLSLVKVRPYVGKIGKKRPRITLRDQSPRIDKLRNKYEDDESDE